MVKNPPSNAGDAGSIPDQGTKIAHAMEQLSPRTTTKTWPDQRTEIKQKQKQKPTSEHSGSQPCMHTELTAEL